MKKLKYCILILFLSLTVFFLNTQRLVAEGNSIQKNDVHHVLLDKDGFSFDYPAHYEKINEQALKNIMGAVPVIFATRSSKQDSSFNIIAQAGEFQIEKDLISQVNQILKDYRNVGFVDVAAGTPRKIKTTFGDVFNVELFFTIKEIPSISNVTVIPADDKHFILTFVSSDRRNAKAIEKDLQVILGSINRHEALSKNIDKEKIGDKEGDSITADSNNKQSLFAYLLCLLVIVAACIFGSEKKQSESTK